MASGFTAAQTGRTHDRTRPMLQQLRKFLPRRRQWYGPRPSSRSNVGRELQRGRIIMQVVRIGLDLAKYVFEVHGVDGQGNVVIRKTLRRGSSLDVFCQSGALFGRGGSFQRRALLGTRAYGAWSQGPPDKPSVCGTVCENEQK